MRYSWDEKKNRINLRRHGVAFEDAARIFERITLEKVDDRFDYGEVRVYAIGVVNGLEITLIYTDRNDDERRIISAWRAEPHERRAYWKALNGASIRKGIESDAEARATDAEFWKDAKVIWPRSKTLVTMRLDADLLEWFRRERGYQTHINAILRAYMKAHAPGTPQSPQS
ncbi:MAG: BrnT family toxin [Deltaproteobacteria bacterium]|nr:BrnT family toxin [Deltaproteobacteria bacterium]